MSKGSGRFSHRHREGVLSAVSAGFFLILVGVLFILNPDLVSNVVHFFNNLKLEEVLGSNVHLPIPGDGDYLLIYRTVQQFCLVWAVFSVAMLGLRFVFGSQARKKADGFGDSVFWFGAAYLIREYLVQMSTVDTIRWFEFWASIVTLIGVSLIVRGVFLATAWKTRID